LSVFMPSDIVSLLFAPSHPTDPPPYYPLQGKAGQVPNAAFTPFPLRPTSLLSSPHFPTPPTLPPSAPETVPDAASSAGYQE
ncbi:unnamed protein product, partial [Closterium sp. Naga37s-1]